MTRKKTETPETPMTYRDHEIALWKANEALIACMRRAQKDGHGTAITLQLHPGGSGFSVGLVPYGSSPEMLKAYAENARRELEKLHP